jgi:hypothetical protein
MPSFDFDFIEAKRSDEEEKSRVGLSVATLLTITHDYWSNWIREEKMRVYRSGRGEWRREVTERSRLERKKGESFVIWEKRRRVNFLQGRSVEIRKKSIQKRD